MNAFTRPSFSFAILLIAALLLVACAQLPLAPAPSVPDAGATAPFQPTLPQRTLFPTPTVAPNETATSAPAPATSTPASAAVRPSVTATTQNFPLSGVFATTIRLKPEKPTSGGDFVTFYVTFVNTTGKPQTYKWKVKIWNPDDQRNSFGETATLTTEIQPGTIELPSAANWRTSPGPCTPFYARAYIVNPDLSPDPIEFRKPDGSAGPQVNFQVCPAN